MGLCLISIITIEPICFIYRCEFHASPVLQKKIRRSPKTRHDLPEPIKTSWGRMVSRGMVPREIPTQYTTEPLAVNKTGGRGVDGKRHLYGISVTMLSATVEDKSNLHKLCY